MKLDGMLVEYFETENGFIGIAMGDNDNALLSVKYVGTYTMNITMFISIVSTIIFIIIYIKKLKVLKKVEK